MGRRGFEPRVVAAASREIKPRPGRACTLIGDQTEPFRIKTTHLSHLSINWFLEAVVHCKLMSC
jgi:hypothetical protein